MIQNEHEPTRNRLSDGLIGGTGCAGLTAALAAHEQGARVTLLEKTELVGGTTAVSAGALWIPCNQHLIDAGFHDSREEAIALAAQCPAAQWATVEVRGLGPCFER